MSLRSTATFFLAASLFVPLLVSAEVPCDPTVQSCPGVIVPPSQINPAVPGPDPSSCDPTTASCKKNIGELCGFNSDCQSGNCSWWGFKCEAPAAQSIPGTTGGGTGSSGGGVQHAQSGGGINLPLLTRYKDDILGVINGIFLQVLFAVAFIVFIYGVYNYFIKNGASDTEREKGRYYVMWGIIGFVVILSVWGLVAVVGNAFGLSPGGGPPTYPTL